MKYATTFSMDKEVVDLLAEMAGSRRKMGKLLGTLIMQEACRRGLEESQDGVFQSEVLSEITDGVFGNEFLEIVPMIHGTAHVRITKNVLNGPEVGLVLSSLYLLHVALSVTRYESVVLSQGDDTVPGLAEAIRMAIRASEILGKE